MKQSDVVLTEYAKRLSDVDLSWLRIRCKQDVCGDKADIANFLSRDKDVDRLLLTSSSADDLFDMLEQAGNCIQQEYNRRNDSRGKK